MFKLYASISPLFIKVISKVLNPPLKIVKSNELGDIVNFGILFLTLSDIITVLETFPVLKITGS